MATIGNRFYIGRSAIKGGPMRPMKLALSGALSALLLAVPHAARTAMPQVSVDRYLEAQAAGGDAASRLFQFSKALKTRP